MSVLTDGLFFAAGMLTFFAGTSLMAWRRSTAQERATIQRRREASRLINEDIARRSAAAANARTAAANGFGGR